MSDNRAYDPDEYFGRATPREVPDLKAEAAERLRQAIAYARLHAPELLLELVETGCQLRERGTPARKNCPNVLGGTDWCVLPEGHSGRCEYGR